MSLQSDLEDVFSSMEDDTDFSSGIASAVADYFSNITASAPEVKGTVTGGTFAGSGTGKAGCISCSSSDCEGPIQGACDEMRNMDSGGDDKLASAIAKGIGDMMSNATLEVDVSGTLTPPSPGTPSPASDTAQNTGPISNNPSSIEKGLKTCFNAMKDMDSGGDTYFAKQLASLVKTFVNSCTATVACVDVLVGASGTAKLSVS